MAVMGIIGTCTPGTPTVVAVGGEAFFPDPAWFPLVDSGIGITDISQRVAIMFAAPKTGVVTHIEWLGGTSPGNRTITLEGIGADGFPDGVVAASHQQDFGLQTNPIWIAAGPYSPSFSVTAGQLYAVRFKMDAAGSLTMHGWNGWYNAFKLPYMADFTALWGKSLRPPSLILRYDDGQRLCVRDTHPARSMPGTPTAFNNGSSPDERGLRFVSSFSGACKGAVFFAEIDAPAEATLILYDGNDNVIASRAWSYLDHIPGDGFWLHTRWETDVPISAGGVYRLVLRPDGANNVGVYQWTYSTDHEANVMGVLTTRTNGGAWTETAGTSLHAALEMASLT